MTVKYYEWGVSKGGTNLNGPMIPDSAPYGPPQEFLITTGVVAQTISFSSYTKQISLKNRDDTNSLVYRFGSETEWLLLAPYGEIKESVSVASLQVRAVSGTPIVEIVGILKS